MMHLGLHLIDIIFILMQSLLLLLILLRMLLLQILLLLLLLMPLLLRNVNRLRKQSLSSSLPLQWLDVIYSPKPTATAASTTNTSLCHFIFCYLFLLYFNCVFFSKDSISLSRSALGDQSKKITMHLCSRLSNIGT
jgi:hypothetical protein